MVSQTTTERPRMSKGREQGPIPFYPYHLYKEVIVAALLLAVLIFLALVLPNPMEKVADPTDTSYIPRPEWYFLFLFQMLKYFPGKLETVAALGVPGVVLLYLVLLPFLDRRPEKPAKKRPLVTTVGILGLVAVLALTSLAQLEDFQRQRALAAKPPGLVVYEANKCDSCHVLNGKGGDTGPDLTHEGSMGRTTDWQAKHLKDPASVVSGSFMTKYDKLTDEQVQQLVDYLQSLK